MKSIYIIAEAGVNHNGDEQKAFKLVDAAVKAGADAVKFQTFKAENVVTQSASKADYQKKSSEIDESQLSMLKRLELTHEMHFELIDYCNKAGITFLSTAFDLESLDFLSNKLGLTTLKIPSGEITNGPLLLAHALLGCDLIVSTGMATLGEIEDALGVVAFGLIESAGASAVVQPSREAFQQAYFSSVGQQLLKEKVTLLHCTTEYPAPVQDINLKAMLSMRDVFGLSTGYSDHSEGIAVPIAAAAHGAVLIEKHFTLDKTLPGPDHKASLEPDELSDMVAAIRVVEQVMGSGLKGPMASELGNRVVARKSLVAARSIKKGEILSENNINVKRPGIGISPMEYWGVVGENAKRDYVKDEAI